MPAGRGFRLAQHLPAPLPYADQTKTRVRAGGSPRAPCHGRPQGRAGTGKTGRGMRHLLARIPRVSRGQTEPSSNKAQDSPACLPSVRPAHPPSSPRRGCQPSKGGSSTRGPVSLASQPRYPRPGIGPGRSGGRAPRHGRRPPVGLLPRRGPPACVAAGWRAPAGKSRRRRAYPQQIVTTRLLYCLQDPFAQLSRLQRI
jgi:hypothetical protein